MNEHSEAVKRHNMVRSRRMNRVRAYKQGGRTAKLIDDILLFGCVLFFVSAITGVPEAIVFVMGGLTVFGIVVVAPLWHWFNRP